MRATVRVEARLRACRSDEGLSLAALARRVGIPVDGVRKIALGRTRPTLVTVLRIADALQVEVENLFGRDDVD